MSINIEFVIVIINFIGAIMSVVAAILTLRGAYKAHPPNSTYQNCRIDNRSVTLSQTNQKFYHVNTSPQSSKGGSDGGLMLISFLGAGILYQYIEIFHLLMSLICLSTLILFIHLIRENIKAGVRQSQIIVLYTISYALCFVGLALVDQSLTFKLIRLDNLNESIKVFMTVVGMVLIPLAAFNPLSEIGKLLRGKQPISYSYGRFLGELAPSIVSFFFCSGIIIDLVDRFAPHF